MRIAIVPFFSQQDKRSGKFRLSTCGACKQLAFLAERMLQKGWEVDVMLPGWDQCADYDPFPNRVRRLRYHVPASNRAQRVHWDARELDRLCAEADVVLCNHETAAIPVKALFPAKRVVQMCNVQPDDMCVLAWRAADLVVMQGTYAAAKAAFMTDTRVTHWPLAYDEGEFTSTVPWEERDVDVLFVNRASASNYTHHVEFAAAMHALHVEWQIVDVTGFCAVYHPNFPAYDGNYVKTLYRSKVAVALNDNWYGGLSIREAVAAGCLPVVLDCPCYRALVGEGWPHCCTLENIRETVRAALERPSDSLVPKLNASTESYQKGWPKVESDLCSLL